jgi:hypothetical protein
VNVALTRREAEDIAAYINTSRDRRKAAHCASAEVRQPVERHGCVGRRLEVRPAPSPIGL